ncbi:DUF4920 domain-containing protein [bacterium]|nr:DUF4920 domain-containing protein [bacterium]
MRVFKDIKNTGLALVAAGTFAFGATSADASGSYTRSKNKAGKTTEVKTTSDKTTSDKTTSDKTTSDKTKWGEKIVATNTHSLSKAISTKSLLNTGKEFVVTGTAEKICIKKGCWMMITDNKTKTRVTFKDYGFFVSDNLIGKKIRAQGVLKTKTMSKGEVQHYLEDEGFSAAEAKKMAKEKTTYSFVASGVEIVM